MYYGKYQFGYLNTLGSRRRPDLLDLGRKLCGYRNDLIIIRFFSGIGSTLASTGRDISWLAVLRIPPLSSRQIFLKSGPQRGRASHSCALIPRSKVFCITCIDRAKFFPLRYPHTFLPNGLCGEKSCHEPECFQKKRWGFRWNVIQEDNTPPEKCGKSWCWNIIPNRTQVKTRSFELLTQ